MAHMSGIGSLSLLFLHLIYLFKMVSACKLLNFNNIILAHFSTQHSGKQMHQQNVHSGPEHFPNMQIKQGLF